MSLSLSGFFSELQSVAGSIQNFFNGISSAVSNVLNTGQGIFAGLVHFGGALWDALIKAFQSLANGIFGAFKWIYNAALYAFDTIVGLIQNIIGFFTAVFNQIWASLNSIFSTVATSVNAFFSQQIKTFRSKIKQMIITDLAIAGGYPAIRDLPSVLTKSMIDGKGVDAAFKSFGMAILSPFAGAIAGAIFGELVDALIGPTDLNVVVMPSIEAPPFIMQQMTATKVTPLPDPFQPSPYAITNTAVQTLSGALAFNIVRIVTGPSEGLGADLAVVVTGPSSIAKPLSGALLTPTVAPLGSIHASLGG